MAKFNVFLRNSKKKIPVNTNKNKISSQDVAADFYGVRNPFI